MAAWRRGGVAGWWSGGVVGGLDGESVAQSGDCDHAHLHRDPVDKPTLKLEGRLRPRLSRRFANAKPARSLATSSYEDVYHLRL